jgi:hypothetical protein
MSDPAHPVQTDMLTQLPMLSPHESLSLNPLRGLLAAVLGNPSTYPGLISIYDASQDCRHPVLDSTALVARFGHEGNFSADGKTFYAAGTAVKAITAIDVTDPKHPHAIWQGNEYSHGLTRSDDGNRAYVADPMNGQVLILDTGQIQAREPNAQVSEISRLTWNTASIPQNAIPMTIHGHSYILEFDEYAFRFNGAAPPGTVGAARIIDIADERHPRVVSNIRLEVNQPTEYQAASGDPGATSPAQGYAAHYCNIPREADPGIVACSFIASGLRVFDIHDPLHPKEIAYYVAPPSHKFENLLDGSSFEDAAEDVAAEAPQLSRSRATRGVSPRSGVARREADAATARRVPAQRRDPARIHVRARRSRRHGEPPLCAAGHPGRNAAAHGAPAVAARPLRPGPRRDLVRRRLRIDPDAYRFCCQNAISPPVSVRITLRQPAGPSRGSSSTAAPRRRAESVVRRMSSTST